MTYEEEYQQARQTVLGHIKEATGLINELKQQQSLATDSTDLAILKQKLRKLETARFMAYGELNKLDLDHQIRNETNPPPSNGTG